MIIGAGNEDIHLEPLRSPHSWCCVSKDTFWAKLNWMNGIRFSVLSVKSGCKLSFKLFVLCCRAGSLLLTLLLIRVATTPVFPPTPLLTGSLCISSKVNSLSQDLLPLVSLIPCLLSRRLPQNQFKTSYTGLWIQRPTFPYKIKIIEKWNYYGGSPKIINSFIDSEDYCFRWESC